MKTTPLTTTMQLKLILARLMLSEHRVLLTATDFVIRSFDEKSYQKYYPHRDIKPGETGVELFIDGDNLLFSSVRIACWTLVYTDESIEYLCEVEMLLDAGAIVHVEAETSSETEVPRVQECVERLLFIVDSWMAKYVLQLAPSESIKDLVRARLSSESKREAMKPADVQELLQAFTMQQVPLRREGPLPRERTRMEGARVTSCTHLILRPAHYRQDGTCRCNDPGHDEMCEWGYIWDAPANKWIPQLESPPVPRAYVTRIDGCRIEPVHVGCRRFAFGDSVHVHVVTRCIVDIAPGTEVGPEYKLYRVEKTMTFAGNEKNAEQTMHVQLHSE